MKKVLIITSRKAYPILQEAINELKQQIVGEYAIDVKELPIDVISLATSEFLEYHFEKLYLSSYDYVIVPGTVKHDFRQLSEKRGVKIVKSPSRISLLKTMFLIGLDKFSPSIPGDDIIRKHLITLLDKARSFYLSKSKGIKVGDLIVPYHPPPFVIGFYLNHKWSSKWLKKYIQKHRPDILYISNESYEQILDNNDLDNYILAIPPELVRLEEISDRAKILYGLSSSQIRDYIDSSYILQVNINDPAEIREIMEQWGEPTNIIFNLVITSWKNILEMLYKAKHYDKAVLSTWITSISSLYDLDSHSLHAFLMELFREAGISLVVVAEFEEKLFWSLREVLLSRDLLTLSSYLDIEPRDLGLDLLYIKDKEYYDIDLGRADRVIIAENETAKQQRYNIDPLGIFKIKVNHSEECIEAMYIGRKGRILIKGKSEESIREIILREKLVSSMSHAFYLGKELGKAEEALRIGKNYEQEKPLFKKPYTIDEE
ncbi:MAG: hypothetical protein J7L82_01995 [Staphylothermus sp.]|nr:hypothetical protein [Staphylothermus sp.]